MTLIFNYKDLKLVLMIMWEQTNIQTHRPIMSKFGDNTPLTLNRHQHTV